MQNRQQWVRRALPLTAVVVGLGLLAGCGGGASTATPGAPAATTSSGTGAQVLPVASNPISNSSTAAGLTITKALVENNVSAETGKAASDHLEIELRNTTSKRLTEIAVYFKITDPSKKVSEGYYTKLTGFTLAPGATRVAHFDQTGARDHYPVNKYSLYYTDKNALVVDIVASASGLKPATFTVKKDSGGAEAGVE